MDNIYQIIDNILLLSNAMSFYILFGLLIAGVLKQLIPDDFISSHLGENKTSSVIKATLLGIPMPVCSCSVIPLAKSLQKEGANKGAVQSFLISAPITGADSMMATYSFFGWAFTIYRVATSVIMAIVAGLLQNWSEETKTQNSIKKDNSCSSCECGDNTKKIKSNGFSLKESFIYAYGTLFKDIYISLFIGLIIGGIFTTFLPKELLIPLFEYQFLTYIAVLIIAMPLYVCATASLPIAGAFLLSGMSGGGAFVFLSAGPATNSVTMGVVASMFGKKSLFIYLGTISIMSIMFGYFFDIFFTDIEAFNFTKNHEELAMIDIISTTIMFSLIIFYLIKNLIKRKK